MNEFTTVTDSALANKERMRVSLLIGLCFTLVNLLSLEVSVSLFLMVELVVLAIIFLCIQLPKKNQDWTLHFEGDELHVKNNFNGETYEVYAVPTTDFKFRQSKKMKELDCADLQIRRTMLGFPCVKNVTAMRQYIQEHFAKYDV